MIKYLMLAAALAFATPALAHTDSKFTKGPNGGHIVDAGGGTQHLEMVATGGELILYVTDADEKPVDTAGGNAEAQVLVAGKTHKVALTPAGGHIMKGKGDFGAKKGMRVILKTSNVGGASHQVRLTPLN
ncbi:MAG: hypothetical protein SFW09_15435 [Hyphomicrobiaceae bacterium]|nr:hypothetical protein [Hyphomicrobiaceae bacterium]